MPITTRTLQASTGSSIDPDAFVAAREAFSSALAGCSAPNLILCFASVHYDQDELMRGMRSLWNGTTPFLGGSTSAVMTERGWVKRGVAVMCLDLPAVLAIGTGKGIAHAPQEAGRQAARDALTRMDEPPDTWLTIPPISFKISHSEIVRGLMAETTGVSITGAGTCFDPFLPQDHPLFFQDFQYAQAERTTDQLTVLGIRWEDERRDFFAWATGLSPLGISGKVTGSTGNRLYEIDGQPAGNYFKRFLGDSYDMFSGTSVSVGLLSFFGEEMNLHSLPALRQEEDGAFVFAEPVSVGMTINLVQGTHQELLDGAREAALDLKRQLAGKALKAVIVFSCGGRHLILNNSAAEELAHVQEVLGTDIPLIGFHAGGEIAPLVQGGHKVSAAACLSYSLTLYAIC